MTILQVENVSKHFGGIKAVDGVSFALEEGEVSAIIGPNGAGKSTLFNVLTGLMEKDSGRVVFKGEDITKLAPYETCRKGISRTFQLLNIFQRLPVYQNIQIAVLAGRGQTLNYLQPAKNMVKSETEEILESIGLTRNASSIVNEMSYGGQRRLEIGIALASYPTLVFLDEPTAGLGIDETRDIMNLIHQLVDRRGLTMIVVEHKMDVVFSISQKIRVLHEGRLIFEGLPADARRSDEVRRVYLGEEG